jgi:hypothetical protein
VQPALRKSMFPFDYTHAGFDHTQFDELAGQDTLSSAKRIAGRVGDGYVALFAASNSDTVEWATLENAHYNCSDGDHKSCHPSIIASTDSHGRGACEPPSIVRPLFLCSVPGQLGISSG